MQEQEQDAMMMHQPILVNPAPGVGAEPIAASTTRPVKYSRSQAIFLLSCLPGFLIHRALRAPAVGHVIDSAAPVRVR